MFDLPYTDRARASPDLHLYALPNAVSPSLAYHPLLLVLTDQYRRVLCLSRSDAGSLIDESAFVQIDGYQVSSDRREVD